MAEHPDPRAPKGAAAEPAPTPKQLQALAHSRGRICKVKSCKVCAPRREERRLKKAQRRADAQAQHHAKGEPCGRNSCELPTCVAARAADGGGRDAASSTADETRAGAGESMRRQADRHRAGLPCGSEHCANLACRDAFALERARRHRARRPCKSLECELPICVAARTVA